MKLVTRNVAGLSSPALDWAVASIKHPGDGYMNAVQINPRHARSHCIEIPDHANRCYKVFRPSADWAQCGPLIEKYSISLFHKTHNGEWHATIDLCDHSRLGQRVFIRWHPTSPLIAACRAIVASVFGSTVEVPEQLIDK